MTPGGPVSCGLLWGVYVLTYTMQPVACLLLQLCLCETFCWVVVPTRHGRKWQHAI